MNLSITAIFSSLVILLSFSPNAFAAVMQAPLSTVLPYQPDSVVPGDFDADSSPDAAILMKDAGGDTVRIFKGNGDGTFTFIQDKPAGSGALSLVSADFNSDSVVDLACVNSTDGTVSIFLGNGNGTFSDRNIISIAATTPVSLLSGDFNSDNLPDLAVITQVSFNVLLNSGNAQFDAPIPVTVGSSNIAALAGHFDSDPYLDLAIADSAGFLWIFPGKGDGTFFSSYSVASQTPVAIAAADLNSDGMDDISLLYFVIGDSRWHITIIAGSDSHYYSSFGDYTAGSGAKSIVISDINRDGLADISAAVKGANSVEVYMNRGDLTFTLPEAFSAGDAPSVIVSANFNLAGGNDLLTAETGVSGFSIMLNASAAAAGVMISPPSHDFGTVSKGMSIPSPYSFTIKNSGSASLSVSSFAFSGATAQAFETMTGGSNCQLPPFTLTPDQSCTLPVRFVTESPDGSKSAVLTVASDAIINSSQQIQLAGLLIDNKLVTALFAGSGSGSILFGDGKSCITQGGCIFQYQLGSTITATALPDGSSQFAGWSGDCSSVSGNICTLQIAGDRSITALFTPYMVRILSTNYPDLTAAFSSSSEGDTLKLRGDLALPENVLINRNISITIEGGYDSTFTMRSGMSTLSGSLTVSDGQVTLDGLTII